MDMATRNSNTGTVPQSGGRSLPWLSPMALLTVLGVAVCGSLAATVLFGRVEGTEFSPQTFELRDYTFFRAPMTDWQITPVVRDRRTTGFILSLRTNGYVRLLTSAARWDVVEVSDGGGGGTGMAQVLLDYLEPGPDRNSSRWSKWTDDCPELAKRFWPIVQQAVCAHAYAALPALFSVASAREETDDRALLDAFSAELQRVLLAEVSALARDAAAAGKRSEAIGMYELVLGHPSLGQQHNAPNLDAHDLGLGNLGSSNLGSKPGSPSAAEIRAAYEALGGKRSTAELQQAVAEMPLVASPKIVAGPPSTPSNGPPIPASATAPSPADAQPDGEVESEVEPDEEMDFGADAISDASSSADSSDTNSDGAEVGSPDAFQP